MYIRRSYEELKKMEEETLCRLEKVREHIRQAKIDVENAKIDYRELEKEAQDLFLHDNIYNLINLNDLLKVNKIDSVK